MNANEKAPSPVSPAKRRAGRLRMTGVTVLLLGIVGAGVVYWLGTRAADMSDDLSMVGFDKSEQRQMGVLYGKQGELIENWSNDLKQPGTQAFIIAAAAILIASGCFYFARLSDYDDETGV
jgi:hypothetical protein